jgi:hypothetical protein
MLIGGKAPSPTKGRGEQVLMGEKRRSSFAGGVDERPRAALVDV